MVARASCGRMCIEVRIAMSAQPKQMLMDLLSPVIESGEGFLEDIEVRAAGRRTLVRLLVDRDGGIDLDEVARLSRAASEVLDAHEAELPFGEYVLEVSSPGVDRPLTQPRHFQRNIGRLLTVTDSSGATNTGRLTAFESDVVTLKMKSGFKEIALAEVTKARVEVEFNPGSGKAAPTGVVEGAGVLSEYTETQHHGSEH